MQKDLLVRVHLTGHCLDISNFTNNKVFNNNINYAFDVNNNYNPRRVQ